MDTDEPRPLRAVLWVGFLLVLGGATAARLRLVLASSPYVLHADEPLNTRRAATMLATGDPDPRFFRYPSLPIYATAGAFAAALALVPDAPDEVGEVEPFYEHPRVALSARFLVALLSVGATALLALAAASAFRSRVHLVLVPLLAAASARYTLQSWAYVNVDAIGAFFCAAAVAQAVLERREGLVARGLVPGLLTGLATGCKYFTGLAGLPALLALLAAPRRRLATLAVLALATLAGFLATTPYAAVDPARFVEQVRFELDHYAVAGHPGAEGEPGLPQLARYLRSVATDLGWLTPFGLLGLAVGLRRHRRGTVLLLAFPAALLALFSMMRTNFVRNVIFVYAWYPVLISLGLAATGAWLARALPARWRAAGPCAVALAALAAAPWGRIREALDPPRDSRCLAAAWIARETPPGATVLLADEVQLDPRELRGRRVLGGPLVSFLDGPALERWAALPEPPLLVAPAVERGSRLEQFYGAPVRRLLDGFELLWSGGAQDVPLKTGVVVHMGDPRLRVLRVAR